MGYDNLDNGVIGLLREQVDLEARLIREYKNSKGGDNVVANLILELLMLDSMKHLAICKSAIKILEGDNLLSSERTSLLQEIDKHIKLESEAYERINRIMNYGEIRNIPGLWSLLERVRYDEKSHHEILKEISEKTFTPLEVFSLRSLFKRPKRSKDKAKQKEG